MNYKAVLTTIGRNIINAAYNAGETVTISTIELGDGGGIDVEVDSSATHLVNSFGEQDIQKGKATDAAISVLARVNDEFDGNVVREFGLKDEDGNLIIYANHPASEIVAGQPLPLEIGCDMYIENAAVVRVAVTDVIAGAFPVNATLALNVNDELYIDENGASWLRSGVTLSNVDDYPLATVSEVSKLAAYALENAELIAKTADMTGNIRAISERYDDTLWFDESGWSNRLWRYDMSLLTGEHFTVSSNCLTSSASHVYTVLATSITEYDLTGTATGRVITIANNYSYLAYAGDDENGPTFYGLKGGVDIYYITSAGESLVTTKVWSGVTIYGIAHAPGSSTIEALVADADRTVFTIKSVDIATGDDISSHDVDMSVYDDVGAVRVGGVTTALYKFNTAEASSQLQMTGARNVTDELWSWTFDVAPVYDIEQFVGLSNECVDPSTGLPIYIRIA